ncbi:MAG TPA: glycosyltransferase family 2 protein [Acidimicrobiales bacterium]|nr:glycosyltransferase family 2 protein [Acidimicrobiales bacterium]
MSEAPRLSVVVTAYNEGDAIRPYLGRLLEAVTMPCEVLVVFDDPEDTTVPPLEEIAAGDSRVVPVRNTYGRGPARAIRYGIDHARAPVAVVTMADGCDDPMQIDQLARLVERGVVIAAASRYMRGGQQIGAPALKSTISRLAGRSLHLLARVGTRDATNSFKAYSIEFVRAVGIESDHGFEVGIELVAKARRHRLPVAEIPTIWLERTQGQSNFKLMQWLPHYFRWYRHAFGPALPVPTAAPGAHEAAAAGAPAEEGDGAGAQPGNLASATSNGAAPEGAAPERPSAEAPAGEAPAPPAGEAPAPPPVGPTGRSRTRKAPR